MVHSRRTDGRGGIDVELVRRLIAAQFPQWARLPVRRVEIEGWDNRTYHLGADMTVRLPSGEGYSPQVEKEQRWLPLLAPQLPLPIPAPIAMGQPGEGYPYHWSVCRWLDGETASLERVPDLTRFAVDLGEFLVALRGIDGTGGPLAGAHSAYRGADIATYDEETRKSIAALGERIDADRVTAVWEAALATKWEQPPVWFHGDVAIGNLLVQDGRLNAVIDFGCSGVGDPACDLVIAWTLFSGESREAFRETVQLDPGTWARGRGWALWKALISVANDEAEPEWTVQAWQDIDRVLTEHESLPG